jgi:hypothetical protein
MDGATVEYLGHLMAFAEDWERAISSGSGTLPDLVEHLIDGLRKARLDVPQGPGRRGLAEASRGFDDAW